MSCSMSIVNNTIKVAKDLGGAIVTYSFFSLSGDERPAGEPFVNGLEMHRARIRRERIQRNNVI